MNGTKTSQDTVLKFTRAIQELFQEWSDGNQSHYYLN